jgi:LuxR family maltose regulon positive regulatory protein
MNRDAAPRSAAGALHADADPGYDAPVTEPVRRPAFPTSRLEEDLLEAKITVPDPQPGSVSRAPLIASARESGCRVVGVTAPAGYGKSTLLIEWARSDHRPVGWVSLDRLDDDPAALLLLLASAFARVTGQSELIDDVRGAGLSVLRRAAPRLAAALRTSPVPFVLLVDDLHVLHLPDCQDVLSVVVGGVPTGSQLVMASRSEQPLLPRLRASGDALELSSSDLALDAEGATTIFARAEVDISPEAASAVTGRTEGWPAGLYLAAVIARDNPGDASTISGDDRFVTDYLYRESLVQVPDGLQEFLRRTAILDQLSAPLCDAVMGHRGAEARLRELEAKSLFLIPLDRRRGWYRYHTLFREFLLAELQRAEPDVVSELQLRAADWYEANGSAALALEHLLGTDQHQRSVQLLTTLVLPTFQAGQQATVRRWLNAVGRSTIERHPPLAVLAGWMAMYAGESAEAQRWAALVETLTYDEPSPDGSAGFASARAMLRAAMCASGPAQMAADAASSVAAEPTWSTWRATALCLSGEAELMLGAPARAAQLFEQSSAVAAALGNVNAVVLCEAELAVLAMDQRRWFDAAEHLRLALATVDERRLDDYLLCVLAFAAAARLAVHRRDPEEEERQLARAMRARPICTFTVPYLAVRMRLQLISVFTARDDQVTARHLMREIDDITMFRPDLGTLLDQIRDVRQKLDASLPSSVHVPIPLTPAELRLLPYLQTHLTFREIGERLFVSRNTVNSQVGSIYRKLGVTSRSDAVEQAGAAGLLGW